MSTQLGDAVNKMGTAFAERMEHEDERRYNEEDIECLDTSDPLEYRRDLARTKAIKLKLKLKRRRLEQELEKAMVGRVPKVLHFGNDDGNANKSKDTAVMAAGTTTGGH
jgi:hypothetical protein